MDAPQATTLSSVSPALRQAMRDLAWAESKPSARQVRGLATLLTPLAALLGVLALIAAAFLGFKGRKLFAGAAGVAGLTAVGTAAVGGATAVHPEALLDPRAGRILQDPRSRQVKALQEAAHRLDAAGPAIAQALLEAGDEALGPARQRAAAWKRGKEQLAELAVPLDQSLCAVGPLGRLGADDGSAELDRATTILEGLMRAQEEGQLRAAAEAEVEALEPRPRPRAAATAASPQAPAHRGQVARVRQGA